MTHITHPYIFRIGQNKTWKSRWFNRRNFRDALREDTLLREWLEKRLRSSHISAIEIERNAANTHVIIKTARPGFLIGRGGEGAEKLKEEIRRKIAKIAKFFHSKPVTKEIKLTIEEVRMPQMDAAVAAQMIVEDLEKRISFRRVLRQSLDKISSLKDVKGVKIALKGRLDGAEMARYEWVKTGRVPLQTMRAEIDYAEKTAYTTYGTIGVKVWIYKGDIFENSE